MPFLRRVASRRRDGMVRSSVATRRAIMGANGHRGLKPHGYRRAVATRRRASYRPRATIGDAIASRVALASPRRHRKMRDPDPRAAVGNERDFFLGTIRGHRALRHVGRHFVGLQIPTVQAFCLAGKFERSVFPGRSTVGQLVLG